MQQSIAEIRALLSGRTLADVNADPVVRAAFERFLEILSEASRHIPEAWKLEQGGDVPWRQVADLERFQQKWQRFCGSETRQNKDLELPF